MKRTGFNVTSAININKESEIDNNEEENKTRRAAPITSNTNEERPVRRVSKYDVVSIKE